MNIFYTVRSVGQKRPYIPQFIFLDVAFGRPARFQTSNFIGPYNLHRLLLSGLRLLFRSLPIVLLDQS